MLYTHLCIQVFPDRQEYPVHVSTVLQTYTSSLRTDIQTPDLQQQTYVPYVCTSIPTYTHSWQHMPTFRYTLKHLCASVSSINHANTYARCLTLSGLRAWQLLDLSSLGLCTHLYLGVSISIWTCRHVSWIWYTCTGRTRYFPSRLPVNYL